MLPTHIKLLAANSSIFFRQISQQNSRTVQCRMIDDATCCHIVHVGILNGDQSNTINIHYRAFLKQIRSFTAEGCPKGGALTAE